MRTSGGVPEADRIGGILIAVGIVAFSLGFVIHPAGVAVGLVAALVGLVLISGPRILGWFDRQLEAGRFHSPGAVSITLVVGVCLGFFADQWLQSVVGDGWSIVLGAMVGLLVIIAGLALADRLPRADK